MNNLDAQKLQNQNALQPGLALRRWVAIRPGAAALLASAAALARRGPERCGALSGRCGAASCFSKNFLQSLNVFHTQHPNKTPTKSKWLKMHN